MLFPVTLRQRRASFLPQPNASTLGLRANAPVNPQMINPPRRLALNLLTMTVTTLLVAAGVVGPPLWAKERPITESAVVGELMNYQDSTAGAVDALVMLGAVQGPPKGYPDLLAARTATTERPGVEAIVRVSRGT